MAVPARGFFIAKLIGKLSANQDLIKFPEDPNCTGYEERTSNKNGIQYQPPKDD